MRTWITRARQRGAAQVLVLAPVLTAGCTDQETPESVAVVEQPIIDGQAVAAGDYPEVGMILRPEGENFRRCTGTLIAPNIVLTAKHCLPQPGDGHFFLQGQEFPFSILNTYPWNPARPATWEVDSLWAVHTDLGLLCIDPVPAKADGGVDPVDVANLTDAAPAIGKNVTTVGVGCTDLETKAGTGTKRKKSWPFKGGNISHEFVVCGGDSGGPTYTPGGKVFMVSSATGVSPKDNEAVDADGKPIMEPANFYAFTFPAFELEVKKKKEEEWLHGCC